MAAPCLGLGMRDIRRIIPRQVGIERPPDKFCHREILGLASLFQLLLLPLGNVDVRSFFAHAPYPVLTYNLMR
jgi:hypothetical protein